MQTKGKKLRNRERGVAMFMAIFALMLLTAIAAGFVFMANTETAINANYRTSQQAYFAAKAGLEEARARIMTGGDIPPPSALPNLVSAQVIYVTNPRGSETVQPWNPDDVRYFDNTLCKANFPSLLLDYGNPGVACAPTAPSGTAWRSEVASILPGTGTADAFPVKWTRVTLKANRSSSPQSLDGSGNPVYRFAVNATTTNHDVPICWDGDKQILLPSTYTNCATGPTASSPEYRPVYLLTSMAVLPNGSKRILSMEAADDPPFFSNSAINSQDYVTLNGSLMIDGYDSCTCKCAVNAKGAEDCSLPRLPYPPATSCLSDKYAIYSNSGVDKPTKSELITAGTDPVIAENQTSKYDLERMIDHYRNLAETQDVTLKTYRTAAGNTHNSSGELCVRNADGSITSGCQEVYGYSCTGSPATCGTQDNQNFGVPPALPPDPPQSPASGANKQERQVSFVPGNLKLTASAKGNGVLVVEGDLEINGGMEFYGLIIVKGVVKFTGGGADKTNIYGSVLAGQSSIDQVVVGGSAAIRYNRCALLNTSSPQPPRMLNIKEISF